MPNSNYNFPFGKDGHDILLSPLLVVPRGIIFKKRRGDILSIFFLFSASLLVDLQKIITIDRNPLSRSNLF